MLIPFSTVLLDFDGNPIQDGQMAFTLGRASIAALTGVFADEEISGAEKFERFDLALKINRADGPLALPPEDIAKIKRLIGKAYSPLIVGRAYEILNG